MCWNSRWLSGHVLKYYTDTCRNSHWLCGHDVGVVIDHDHADTVSAKALTMRTRQRLRGHFWTTFKGFSQILKEQSGKKRTLECLHTQNCSNILSKEKLWCPHCQRLRGHAIFELGDRISSRKHEKFEKPFLSVLMGPRSKTVLVYFQQKNMVENLVTLSLERET